MTKKWIEVNDFSSDQYSVNKNIRFKTSKLRSDLCDYSDAYKNTFKNNAPFRSCISKINSTLMDNADDLDIVMLVCNLLEYSQNYSMTSGSL